MLVHFEGFDAITSGAPASLSELGYTAFPATWTTATSPARYGGRSWAATGLLAVALPAPRPTCTQGVALHLAALPASGSFTTLLQFLDSGSVQVGIAVDSAGHVVAYRGSTANIIATGASVVPTGSFTFYEASVTVGGAGAGRVEVRLNGATTAEFALLANTQVTGAARITHAGVFGSGASNRLDDWYLADDTGGQANGFLGEVRVQTLYPSAAGDSTQFTSSTGGANYEDVNEPVPNGDADYVYSITPGHVDMYGLSDLQGSPTVFGVQLTVQARKDDTGARSITPRIRSGGTNAEGSPRALTDSYRLYRDTFVSNPATGGVWTAPAVNAVQAGVKND